MVEQRLQVALAPTPNPPATMLFDEPELGLHPYFRCRRP
jgi:predicted ATPase